MKELQKERGAAVPLRKLFCLCGCLFLPCRLFRRFCCNINDYRAAILAAGVAHMVPKVQRRAILALRKPRLGERVVRAAIAAVGAGMAHSDYHKGKYSRKGLKSKGVQLISGTPWIQIRR